LPPAAVHCAASRSARSLCPPRSWTCFAAWQTKGSPEAVDVGAANACPSEGASDGASEGAGAAAISRGTGSVAEGATAVTGRAGIFGAAVTVAIGEADETESGGKSAVAATVTVEVVALGVAGVSPEA